MALQWCIPRQESALKRITWRLTLWWRTFTQGPMCQACEGRHHHRDADIHKCAWSRYVAEREAINVRFP